MKAKLIPLTVYEQKLHDLAKKTARVHKRNEPELVAIIEEVDRLRLYEKFDEADTIQYCFHLLELTHSVSYSLQAVARKSRMVPELLTAMQKGLSLSFANKLVAQITPANQAMWIAKAMMLKQTDLEFELRMANPRKRRATKKEQIDKTHSRMSIDIPNSTLELLIRAQELTKVSEADVLDKALNLLLEKIDPVRKADRSLAKRRAKEEATDSSQNSAEAPVDCSAEAPVDCSAEAEWENDFSAETMNRGMNCVTPAIPNKAPLSARTIDEVNERDRGRCQKILQNGHRCGSARWVAIHHIIDRALGGSNDLSNLTTLCSSHHRIHHRMQGKSELASPMVAYVAAGMQ